LPGLNGGGAAAVVPHVIDLPEETADNITLYVNGLLSNVKNFLIKAMFVL